MDEFKESKKTNKKDGKTNSKKLSLNKKSKKLKRGFTLVELLAAITILGILTTISIIGISSVIKRGQKQYYISQEDNMVVAARSYAEKNPQYLPKVSGQTLKVPLKDLVKNKYIDKVVNYQKHNCDENASYVQIFKYQDDYYYVPYLSCEPYYSDPLASNSSFKNFEITFTNKLFNAKASIKMQDDKFGIVSYNYVIYADNKVVFKSDYFDSFKTDSIIGRDIDLSNYVPANIKITITAINGSGVSKVYSGSHDYSVGSNSETNTLICGEKTNSSTTWTSSDKIVSVKCVSTDNSVGCAKETFSKSYTTDTEKDQILIFDRNGNYKKCDVDVYIDKGAPTLNVKVYKLNASGAKDGGAIAESIAKNGDTDKIINVTRNASNGWLNKANYPYGLIVEASYSDTGTIKSLSYGQNSGGITSESDSNYSTITDNTSNPNKKSGSLSFKMTEDGNRYAKIAVTDTANHTSSVTIKFKMDKVVPVCNIRNQNSSWTKNDVSVTIGCTDEGSSGCVSADYSKKYDQENEVKTDSVNISDNAGNSTSCSFDVFHDKVAPTCGSDPGKKEWTSGSKELSVDCSDDGSGCKKNSFSRKWNSSDTVKKGKITITDNAENSSTCDVTVYLDNKAPTIIDPYCKGYRYDNTNDFIIGVVTTDGESGIDKSEAKLEYCYTEDHCSLNATCSSNSRRYSKPKYGADDRFKYASGMSLIKDNDLVDGKTVIYGVLKKSCANSKKTYEPAAWQICDKVGNCANSGAYLYHYYNYNGNNATCKKGKLD